MKITLTFRDYVIIALVLIIVFMRACGSTKCPAPSTVVTHDTSWKTLVKSDTVKIPVPVVKIVDHHPEPITVTDTVFLTTLQHVDTAAILKDYFATRYYADTNSTDLGKVIIRDSVSQNRIKARNVVFDLKFPIVNDVVTIQPKNQIYAGIDLGGTNSWIGIGPVFTLKTKTDKMYHLGASFTTEGKIFYHFGTSWKLHF